MVGDFKSVDDFKSQIRENIGKEKELKEKDKRRAEILEKIIADSKIEMPKLTNSRLKDLSWSLDVLDLQKERGK
jgi:FKBP-type peptidyl-prolyl cis-trans isomerase (trigger factor)